MESRNSCISDYEASKPLILNNIFCSLLCQEPITGEEDLTEDNKSIEGQPQETKRNAIPQTKRRPDLVAPKAPEKGHAFSKSICPGHSTYANPAKHGELICLVGDSIIGRFEVQIIHEELRHHCQL